ncbi:MAG: beta-propeller domain-containing protein [Burkholderiaceae bacterium]|nr:beta-propeller domain-containing protein [Burkholderiaceae bacterium]
MSPKHTFILCISFILLAVIAAGCMSIPATTPPVSSELKKFNSTTEIEQYLADSLAAGQHDGYYPSSLAPGGMGTGVNAPQESTEKSDSNIPAPSIPGGIDYSQTNIQVSGVDEPDIIKNDNRYIYTISGSTLVIIDAYPAEDASILSKIEINDTPRDLFVSGDRLVLFSTDEQRPETSDPYVKAVPPYYRPPSPVTHTTIYDISDRNHPTILKEYSIEGDYLDARMIGSLVYQITREQISPYYGDHIVVPALREGTRTVIQPDVWYFDHPESQYTFTTITSLDASNGKEKDAQTYLLGTGNTLYVSEDAIYVSYPNYHPVIYKGIPQEVAPGLAVDARGSAGISSSQVSAIPPDFNTLPESEGESILDSLRNDEQDAIRRQEADQTTTVIHKIGIRDGAITYLAKGEVPGTLDNQFSMDEYKDNLRVASTSSIYTPRFGQYTYNNVYVLDEKMATIGELTHIAEQETIYSTRFIGDRLYMVTFKRIDPFFVIDLAKPENPKILGKLKIPGYSDYLHPYDATHIIGIGKETTTNDWGGVSTSGVKLALFDVSDVTSPKQLDKVQIGDAGSDSAALSDHHAFLFEKGKNLLVIPVRAVSNEPVTQEDSSSAYRPYVWYGAYVFGLTPETGFTLKGTVQHGSGDSGYYYYGSSTSEVKRSLYIGDILYTMSSKQIKANPLDDLNTTITTIPLPNGGEILYPPLVK